MLHKTYIIIVTYNGEQWIRKSLDSCIGINVIVVDNNSTDQTLKIIETEYPKVILLKQKKNLGFGRANNLGISHALQNDCDYVFLLNQDAYLEKDAIDRIIAVHKNNLEYGILSPVHLNGAGNKLDKNFSSYLRYDANNFIFRDAFKNKLNEVYQITFVNAAAWLLPKETLQKIGGFDPIFFHYGEDDNYCQRAIYHDLKIGVVPKAFVKHDRENVVKRPLDTEAQKLLNLETQIKINYADLNRVNDDFNKLIKYKFNFFIKLIIKLKLKKASFIYKKYMILKTSKNQIIASKGLNIKEGSNYLNF
jgi:GT2 family glycosyltransferase